jgi:hypothetical protein
LIIEALQRFHHYYGNDFKVECPTGCGHWLTLWEVAAELSRRLTRLFSRRPDGTRPASGASERYQRDPHWRDLILFHEYFHGDTGVGLGASHQTGWTALVGSYVRLDLRLERGIGYVRRLLARRCGILLPRTKSIYLRSQLCGSCCSTVCRSQLGL